MNPGASTWPAVASRRTPFSPDINDTEGTINTGSESFSYVKDGCCVLTCTVPFCLLYATIWVQVMVLNINTVVSCCSFTLKCFTNFLH